MNICVCVGHASKDTVKAAKELAAISKSADIFPILPEDALKAKNLLTLVAPSTTITPIKKRKIDGSTFENILKNAPNRQASKKFKKEFSAKHSDYTFESIGGIDKILKELCELLLHIKNPKVYKSIGLPSPRGFLLHGPPGVGKTLLAQAIAGVC